MEGGISSLRVFLTGATGFIGGNVAKKLIDYGYKVNVLIREKSNTMNIDGLPVKIFYGDIRKINSVRKAVYGCKGLFHAAACYSFWSKNPEEIYDINVGGTRTVLMAAYEAGVEKVVYTSSESTVKVRNNGILATEEKLSSLEELSGDYKKSKLLAELEVLKFCGKGLPVVIVNPTAPVGKFDIKPTPTGKIILDLLNRKMPAYLNTGLNIIDVEDVAMGHLLAFEKGRIGQRYILGNKNLTLKQIIDMVCDISNIKSPELCIPFWLAMACGGIDEFVSGRILKRHPKIPLAAVKTARKFRYFDCSKAVSELGLPQSPIEVAFEKSVAWFRENGYVKD